MNRRDAIERILMVISAALFAIFGIRPDVDEDEIARVIRDASSKMEVEGELLISKANDVLKRLFPQTEIHRFAYGRLR